MIDFKNQSVIVTGAGRGLGRLYALEFARRGASVVVNDIGSSVHGEGTDSHVADQVVEEICAAGGIAVASYDSVASPEGGEAIVRTATDRFGRLDAVVSNAGIFNTVSFEQMKIEAWRRMLNVHLDGSFHLSQPAYRVMKSQGHGRFVFVTSSIACFGHSEAAHYAAAKGGILGLTNAIAVEGEPHGILANSVLPTGLSRMVLEGIKKITPVGVEPEQVVAEMPLFRIIDPKLVVPIVIFLASRACTLTHHHYSAGAGRYARTFIGLANGWLSEANSEPTADDIAAHLAEVSATDPYMVPASVVDETLDLCTRRGIMG
jgi:NAD(P)-dependent dehydrogenase (short-subunit alcohol dehydrogenase family)